ncbi:thermonuclease family protein [Roseomonas sp. KE0001]|uniref:thermonuclease family protein n=1 Tax=Roseomonas sp. KE0001 TaxID=2479201 RepID=UPI0018DF7321|nr:thermonuclease family protein [Roseomonas sp. KE0001]MBI0436207.1 nuclease [Roseomonas sp. KE0001]
MPVSRLLLAPALLLLLLSFPALAAKLRGEVVGISDGDTLTLLTPDKRQVRVRLAEIDAPESRQPWGSRAQQALSTLVFRQAVVVTVQDTDRYGRTVGTVWVDRLNANAEMVRQGQAWVYRQYLRDRSLLALEEEAKQAKRGLWALPEGERVPPWQWRRQGQSSQPAPAPLPRASAATGSAAFTCGGKRLYREMSSCAEARFHLQQCGLSRLDGDRDGVPCESLCR